MHSKTTSAREMRSGFPENLVLDFLIALTAIAFVTHISIVNNLLYFDVLLLLQLAYFLSQGFFSLQRITVHILIVLNIFLVISLLTLPLSEDINGSLPFFYQYFFTFNLVPLYIDWLIRAKKIRYFLKTSLVALSVNSLLFIIFSLVRIFINSNFRLLHFGDSGLFRFSWGDGIVSNDLIHYYIFSLFIVWYLYSDKHIRRYLFFTFSYLFTLSRTFLAVSVLFYFFKLRLKKLFTVVLFAVGFVMILPFTGVADIVPNLNRLIYFSSLDYSLDPEEDLQARANLAQPIFENIDHFILFPLYGNPLNVRFHTDVAIPSVHNVFLSLMVNFGITAIWFPDSHNLPLFMQIFNESPPGDEYFDKVQVIPDLYFARCVRG
jgi:hypothetical protein